MRVTIEEFEIPCQLFNPVDISPAFDFHGDVVPLCIRCQNVNRADSCHVFPTDQAEALSQEIYLLSEELLKICLDAVFDEAGINSEVVNGVGVNLVNIYQQQVGGLLVQDFPGFDDSCISLFWFRGKNLKRAGWRHPVEGFIASAIGVDEDAAIAFDHDDSGREGEMCAQSTCVIH
jgi:hypothetical protein